jgi:hypothetical protein
MTAIVLPRSGEYGPSGHRGVQWTVAIMLAVWFLLVVSLGAAGAFVGPPGKPPLPMAIGVTAPLLLFLAWIRASRIFREFVLSIDLRLNIAMQAWRWAGMGFIDLYAYKVLPAVFALPAGLGDMAIGITAPWVILALARRADFAASPAFVRWNLLGILDLVVAISIGTVGAFLATGAPGEISTTPLTMLPLLLIPAYFVPLFLMLHIAALLQSQRLRRSIA